MVYAKKVEILEHLFFNNRDLILLDYVHSLTMKLWPTDKKLHLLEHLFTNIEDLMLNTHNSC